MQLLSPGPILVLIALAGWLAGGLANLAVERLPQCRKGRPLEGNACRALSHYLTLPWYWLRRGACPSCGSTRPATAPLLELATALAFPLVWFRLGEQPAQAALVCAYTAFLLAVLVIDLEHRLVLNVMLAPAALLALAASILNGGPTPMQALIGGLGAFSVFFLLAIIGRGALGFGDVKLAGLIGLMAGYPAVVGALFTGVVLGGVGALVLIILRKATRKTAIAYAPYLVMGALIAILVRGAP